MKNNKKITLIISIVVAFIIIISVSDYDTQKNNNLSENQTLSFQNSLKNSNNEIVNESKLTKITDLSNEEINEIKDKITKESSLSYKSCDENIEGECVDKNTGKYYIQTKIKEGKPSRTEQVITGYRTLCRDGEYSPSNAKGRGACSHHGGVADWNAPVYGTKYIEATSPQYKKEEVEMETTQAYKSKYNLITDDEIINYYNLHKK